MSTVIIVPREIGPVPITAFLYEQHRSEAVVTDNPIEDGSSISDHIYTEPKGLTLEIAEEKATDAFIGLVEHQALREPFDLVTGLAVYTNMVIVAIVADREKSTSKILRATVELREVIIVGTQASLETNFDELPPTVGPSGEAKTFDQTSPTVERGDSQVATVPAEQSESILSGILL